MVRELQTMNAMIYFKLKEVEMDVLFWGLLIMSAVTEQVFSAVLVLAAVGVMVYSILQRRRHLKILEQLAFGEDE